MRIARFDDSEFKAAYGIRMAHLELSASACGAAVGISHGIVDSGTESALHHHDESEAFVVISGSGLLLGGTTPIPVCSGDVVTFDPFETHILRNDGDVPLVFADLYWRDSVRAVAAATENGMAAYANRPVFVFSTPPTPNGDLHLGHLSGPYLGADVFTRFQVQNGHPAVHITGSDDFQSYILLKARQLGQEPETVVANFAQEIAETLALCDIHVDQYTLTSKAPGYREGLQAFFAQLTESGIVHPATGLAAFDARSGAYLYEPNIGGNCPGCGATCSGNICEECGEPNLCTDLVNPVARGSGEAPRLDMLKRHVLPLGALQERVLALLRRGKASPRLHALAARVFARDGLEFPVTHPQPWGVPPLQPAGADQVIWVWPEMSYGFLYGIEALGGRLGKDWKANAPQDEWKFVHFFGYDNSFYHTVLYPALYSAAFPEWEPEIDYNVNEFYLLEGQKFSTSRRHAVWGKEVLAASTVDAVRYHLCLTRGEVERANFTVSALDHTYDAILRPWDEWLAQLGDTVSTLYNGQAPDAGEWMAEHRAFLARLEGRRAAVEAALSPQGFTLNAAATELNGIVQDAVRFARDQAHLAAAPAAAGLSRTAVALQLAAAKLLAACGVPVLPRFAGRLASGLGLDMGKWPRTVTLVAPGSPVNLGQAPFFAERPSARQARSTLAAKPAHAA